MAETKKARAVGLNHVALEVGDIEEALAFYGRLFEFKLRSKTPLRLSSIWAANFSHCREVGLNRLTMDVILGLWSTTRMPSVRRLLTRG
jgi:catechol-2,3-dioxygenase